MGPGTRVSCRTIAPLLARYNDPDLSEAEQVQLSMHLLGCPACLARLQEYRALDRRMRVMPSVTIAPHVRSAVLDHVASAGGSGFGGFAATLAWRHAWSGMSAALSLATFVLAVGLATAFAARPETNFAATATGQAFGRPLATTFLVANPTRVVSQLNDTLSVKAPVMKAQPTRPAAVAATIRAINWDEGRIVVTLAGARGDERLAVMRDTAIVLADGRPGTLADLAVGVQVQLQREVSITGSLIAREIVVPR